VWKRVSEALFKAGSLQQPVPVADYLDDQFISGANEFDRAQVEADVKDWAESNL
jgi:hypothetical protein